MVDEDTMILPYLILSLRDIFLPYATSVMADETIKDINAMALLVEQMVYIHVLCSYGHTRLKAPGLVRSLKLSKRWPGQYCGGRPRGNTGCRSFLNPFFILIMFSTPTVVLVFSIFQSVLVSKRALVTRGMTTRGSSHD